MSQFFNGRHLNKVATVRGAELVGSGVLGGGEQIRLDTLVVLESGQDSARIAFTLSQGGHLVALLIPAVWHDLRPGRGVAQRVDGKRLKKELVIDITITRNGCCSVLFASYLVGQTRQDNVTVSASVAAAVRCLQY